MFGAIVGCHGVGHAGIAVGHEATPGSCAAFSVCGDRVAAIGVAGVVHS